MESKICVFWRVPVSSRPDVSTPVDFSRCDQLSLVFISFSCSFSLASSIPPASCSFIGSFHDESANNRYFQTNTNAIIIEKFIDRISVFPVGAQTDKAKIDGYGYPSVRNWYTSEFTRVPLETNEQTSEGSGLFARSSPCKDEFSQSFGNSIGPVKRHRRTIVFCWLHHQRKYTWNDRDGDRRVL